MHTFFQQEVTPLAENDLSHRARDLASAFTSDAKARLYFLAYALLKVNSLNSLFQSEDFTLHEVYTEMVDIITTLMSMYMKSSDPLQNPRNPHNFLCLEQVKIGVRCQLELNTLNDSVKKAIRTDCLSFLVELCFQIKQRINLSEMKLLSILDPALAMKSHQNHPSILPITSKFCYLLDKNELDALGDERDELPNVLKIHCTEDVTSMTALQFWHYVRKLKNGIGEPRFPHLGPLFKLMSLPHSTAAVERVFSSVNSVKTSKSNKTDSQT